MKRLFCGLMALGLLVGLAADAKAQPTYSFTTIDVPGSSLPSHTYATGINALGQIVGYSDVAGAFLYDQGSYATLTVPGATNTKAYGINDSGQIVGSYDGHGFLLDHGSYTTLDVPGSVETCAYGINSSGQIVGNSSLGAFQLDQGSYTMIDVPGSTSTQAFGINDSGQIVGSYNDVAGQHGFLATPVP